VGLPATPATAVEGVSPLQLGVDNGLARPAHSQIAWLESALQFMHDAWQHIAAHCYRMWCSSAFAISICQTVITWVWLCILLSRKVRKRAVVHCQVLSSHVVVHSHVSHPKQTLQCWFTGPHATADELAGKNASFRKQWVFLADPSASAGAAPSAEGAADAKPYSAGDAAAAPGKPANLPPRPWLLAVQLHAASEALQFLDPNQHTGKLVAMRDLRLRQARPSLRLWDADATDVRLASAPEAAACRAACDLFGLVRLHLCGQRLSRIQLICGILRQVATIQALSDKRPSEAEAAMWQWAKDHKAALQRWRQGIDTEVLQASL
jgi:hypothetical protein